MFFCFGLVLFCKNYYFVFLVFIRVLVVCRCLINIGGRKGWSREEIVFRKLEEMIYGLLGLKVEFLNL